METFISALGICGGIVLVLGAACPEGKNKRRPTRSLKNWLFAGGAVIMFIYSLMNYLLGDGSIFFAFLEGFVVIASIMMMLNVPDKIDLPVISIGGLGFVIASLMLFEGFSTLIFVAGLIGIGLGYALQMGTVRREVALVLGSLLIAIFSFLESSWIFFWLNAFFAIFSGYYMVALLARKK